MKKSDIMKIEWLKAMANYVLENGLNSATLRPLAKAADTSGRMLIYHFGTKEQLIAELLQYIDKRMEMEITKLLPKERSHTREECVKSILAVLRTVEKSGFFRIWYEIVARASLGDTLYINIAKSFSDTVVNWLIANVPETEKTLQRQPAPFQ